MSESKRVRVLAGGRVQGVFFRDSTRQEAERLGVSGWVANRADGRVEAEFQGPAEAVDEAVAFVRRGPGRANVTELNVEDLEPVQGASGFVVR